MSFSTIPIYLRALLPNVDADFKEWDDAFNIENIPSTILDKSWHVGYSSFTYQGSAQNCLGYSCPVTLSLFLKGYRHPQEAIDSALFFADAITKEVCKPSNRLNQAYIKNVLPGTIRMRALAQDNDNTVVLELGFNFNVYLHL